MKLMRFHFDKSNCLVNFHLTGVFLTGVFKAVLCKFVHVNHAVNLPHSKMPFPPIRLHFDSRLRVFQCNRTTAIPCSGCEVANTSI